jgi:hypothetical protein
MRITDDKGKALSSVSLALTDAEARELAGDLSELQSAKKGWHAHVKDEKYEREITIYREDDETARFQLTRRAEQERRYAELERRLKTVISDLGPILPNAAKDASLEYTDHNEHGLALELVRDCIIANELPISAHVADELVQLAEMMELPTQKSALRGRIAP